MKIHARWLIMVVAGILVIGLSACGGGTQASIEARDPWIRAAVATGETPMDGVENGVPATDQGMGHDMGHDMGNMEESAGATSAAYMTLVNNGNQADRLISAATDVAEAVELHISEMDANGTMSMRPVENIEVPANGQVELKPGGLHIMLIGLKQDLKDGDTVNLTLNLENAGPIELAVPVRQP